MSFDEEFVFPQQYLSGNQIERETDLKYDNVDIEYNKNNNPF